MRKKISKKSLLKIAGDVAYEIQLFHYVYIMWSKPEINRDNLLCSIFIENFVIHARNLYGFFYRQKGKQPRADDVIVEDFLNSKMLIIFKTNRTKKVEIDKVFKKKRADKELAHITYYRLKKTPETKKWKMSEIYSQMKKTIGAFLNVIDNEQRKKVLCYKYLDLFVQK